MEASVLIMAITKTPETPEPTTGRVVRYTLSDADIARIRNEQELRPEVAYGNPSHVGDVVPLIVVRAYDERHVSGHVLLDSPQSLWVSDAAEGDSSGQWHYPERA